METKRGLHILVLLICVMGIFSCDEEEDFPIAANERTLFMYMPWSTNLTDYFYNNISDMEKAISQSGLDSERVLVFLSTSPSQAELFEIKYDNGACTRNVLKEYVNPEFTTEKGLTAIIGDVKVFAPAPSYSMIIGCHGMGWLPVEAEGRSFEAFHYHWDYPDAPMTRFFGGLSPKYQTDVITLAQILCGNDAEVMTRFNALMGEVIPYKVHTEKFYTASRGPLLVGNYSGITTSEPSANPKVSSYRETSWYRSTH